jgi:hydroxymethylpyrimidine pyrophosphatase-like HAD family hydrolase
VTDTPLSLFDWIQVMAIGDGDNDIEMLSMVGWGVAMANATERTKAVADAVTSSNNEDGVAKAIQNFILSGVFY